MKHLVLRILCQCWFLVCVLSAALCVGLLVARSKSNVYDMHALYNRGFPSADGRDYLAREFDCRIAARGVILKRRESRHWDMPPDIAKVARAATPSWPQFVAEASNEWPFSYPYPRGRPGPNSPVWERWGFHAGTDETFGEKIQTRASWVVFPCWFAALLAGVPSVTTILVQSARAFRRRRAARWARAGKCPSCAYPIRTSSARCPECGTAVLAEPKARPEPAAAGSTAEERATNSVRA